MFGIEFLRLIAYTTHMSDTNNKPKKYGRLTFVRELSARDKGGRIMWEVLCDCGNTRTASRAYILGGKLASCSRVCKSRLLPNPVTPQAAGAAHRARIQKFVDGYKANSCADCGYTYPSECMDFDHISGAVKVANVSDMHGHHTAWAEIQKCQLVCSNCHRIRTRQRTRASK